MSIKPFKYGKSLVLCLYHYNKLMKIVFFGSSQFAQKTLFHLLEKQEDEGYSITGVVTKPDASSGRGMTVTPNVVKQIADKFQIPSCVNTPEIPSFLQNLNPDLCIVASYGKIISAKILSIPPKGFLNIHGSYLPKLRGAIPMQKAIFDGLTESGVSIIKMDEGMDTGDILIQEKLSLQSEETFGSLADRIAEIGVRILVTVISAYGKGELPLIKQNASDATYCYIKQIQEIKEVDWMTHRAIEIDRAVRSIAPFEYITKSIGDITFQLISVRPSEQILDLTINPGEFRSIKQEGIRHLYVGCKDGMLELLTVKPTGKREMSGAEFVNGYGKKLGI